MQLIRRSPLKPLVTGDVRKLVVSQEINALLDGLGLAKGFPDIDAERRIGVFSAGYLLRVSRKKNDKKPDLERLEGFDEIWCFCIRRPPPGWRLLGRFIARDRLVVTRAWDKNLLAANYSQAAQEVIDDWALISGGAEPLRSENLEDYLSGTVHDVDTEEE